MAKPKQKPQPKSKGLFDDVDSLSAEFDAAINEIDSLSNPNYQAVPKTALSAAATRPDLPLRTKDGFLWQRPEEIQWNPEGKDVAFFLDLLREAAKYYVWNDFDNGEHIRGWSKTGCCFDPITAVAAVTLQEHYSMCISDVVAAKLGLNQAAGKDIAFVCWNIHQAVLQKHDLYWLRERIIATIREGML